MLGASIGELLAHKQAEHERDHSPIALEAERKATHAEKRAEQERMRIEARNERARQHLIRCRNDQFNMRNSICFAISQFMYMRKDGKNVCRPGRKNDVETLRKRLAHVNVCIDLLTKQINKPREISDAQVWHINMRLRNEEIVKARAYPEGSSGFNMHSSYASFHARKCRPTNGYPRPLFRRGDEYPIGALDMPPKEMRLSHVTGERDRLAVCIRTLIEREGYSERVVRMCNHLESLMRSVECMLRNPYMSRNRGSRSYNLHHAA
jgi:hypothetical protein